VKKKKEQQRDPLLHSETVESISAILSFLVALIFILAWFGSAGKVGHWLFSFFSLLLGRGYFLLPIVLILDGTLSRVDGILLLLSFVIYISWLFSKKERFTKVYDGREIINPLSFLKDIGIILIGLIMILIGGQGIVKAADFFSKELHLSLGLIGIFLVAIGTCLPETFFSLQAARKNHDWMILGDLMGNVVITATMVLGVVSLIQPIVIADFSPFIITRLFMIVAALSFWLFLRTGHKITRWEGVSLILIYVVFLLVEILTK